MGAIWMGKDRKMAPRRDYPRGQVSGMARWLTRRGKGFSGATGTAAGARRHPFIVAIAVLFLLGLSVPLSVQAISGLNRNPHPTLANNYNDLQDLRRVAGDGSRVRPRIGSGNDTISGQVTDASNGSPLSGVTVYLSDVPQPCNH